MSGKDTDDMTLDKFKFWTVESLKNFLRQRNLSVIGNKEMLVARCFAAYELNIKESESMSELLENLAKEYRSLLNTPDEGQLPDPFTELVSGWMDESSGMATWPPTMIQDISVYLSSHDVQIEKVSLTRRILTDYKDQKAYSYFSSKWLFGIMKHNVTEDSIYCFLKAQCRPSQRLSDIPHDVWICIQKKSGAIQSAYCTCFAGLGQSCNHVAAVLLKVDFCWKYGYIQKASTSTPCLWTQGGKSVTVVPEKVKNMDIKKPTAEYPFKRRKLNTIEKQLFVPHKQEKGQQFADFLSELQEISPSSVTLGERHPMRNIIYSQWDEQKKKQVQNKDLTPSLSDIAARCKSKEEFLENIPMLDKDKAAMIEQETRGQFDNPVWANQRNGRVTASKFREVMTRMEKVKKDRTIDVAPLISRVLGYISPNPNIPALKYGRRMEDVAAKHYVQILRDMGHKNVVVKECGLFVDTEYSYMGASPDRIVSCCCGNGILEIKCPLSCSHTKPTVENTDCLVELEGNVVLNSNHKYFDQIQGQIALTGSDWGDFLVYSSHGHFLQRIEYSESRWQVLHENTSFFFMEFLADELVSRSIQRNVASSQCSMAQPMAAGCDTTQDNVTETKSQGKSTQPVTSGIKMKTCSSTALLKKGNKRGKQAAKRPRPVYLCGTCQLIIKDSELVLSSDDQSILCDNCHTWHHWLCVGLNSESEELGEKEWLCPVCK